MQPNFTANLTFVELNAIEKLFQFLTLNAFAETKEQKTFLHPNELTKQEGAFDRVYFLVSHDLFCLKFPILLQHQVFPTQEGDVTENHVVSLLVTNN